MYPPAYLHIINVTYSINACDGMWVCVYVGVCTWVWGIRMTAQSNLPCSVNCLNLQLKCANEHTADTEKHKYASEETLQSLVYQGCN